MTTAPEDERLFTASDHTAAVSFCLRERGKLAADATGGDAVLRRAADIAGGRIRRVLASAARHHAQDAPPTVEGLRIGLRTAHELLEDGAQTIYRPGYWHEEGVLVASRSATDATAAAQQATAQLADVGVSAAVMAGARSRRSTPEGVEHEVILAAIAASVPVAIVLAEGAHNQ